MHLPLPSVRHASVRTVSHVLLSQPQSITMSSPQKRRRVTRSPSPQYKLDDENDNYEPYVPIAQRRQAKLAAIKSRTLKDRADTPDISANEHEQPDEEDEEEKQRERERKERTLLLEAQEIQRKKAIEGSCLRRLQCMTRRVPYSLARRLNRCTEDRG